MRAVYILIFLTVCFAGARAAFARESGPVRPVHVSGTPMNRINCRENEELRFRCDEKILCSSSGEPTNDSGQFRVVHHELAAIAGLGPQNRLSKKTTAA